MLHHYYNSCWCRISIQKGLAWFGVSKFLVAIFLHLHTIHFKPSVQKMSRKLFEDLQDVLTHMMMHAPWSFSDKKAWPRMQKLKKALSFMSLFADCIDVWEWDDEESRIRLSSTVTALQMLWVDSSSVQSRLFDTWPVDAQAYYSLAFQVQGLIHKSKLLAELWCAYHLASSSFSIRPKNPHSPPTLLSIFPFMERISNYSVTKKQIDILTDKIRIMEKVMNPVAASCTDSNKHLRLKKFTAAFDNKARCLALLYWAKEETTTDAEMSIPLFSTLHSLIPYAPDVIVLISQNLQHTSPDYSIILSVTIASLIDFFFEHLVDNDSFLILRDTLIRLFTSLTHQNASEKDEEEDGLCSQAYALFREHSYVLQPHCDKKTMLLSDFMTQIDTANAKIRRLYFGGISDSCVSSEAEKLGNVYFVSIARELYLLEERVQRVDGDMSQLWLNSVQGIDREMSQLCLYRMELRFMTVFCQCFATWEHADDEDISARLNFIFTCLQDIWQKDEAEKGLLAARFHAEKRLLAARFHAIRRQKEKAERDSEEAERDLEEAERDSEETERDSEEAERDSEEAERDSEETERDSEEAEWNSEEAKEQDFTDWHPLVVELAGKIQTSKIEIEAWCTSLYHLSFQSKPSTSNQIMRLLDSILDLLNDLVTHKAGEIVPFKKQIEILEEKLLFLKNLLILTTNCTQDSKELRGFRMFVQAFGSDAACLAFLWWAKDGNIASEVSPMLSHTLQKITPVTPDVARLYFETLKAIYLQHCDSLLFGQTASFFVDFFTENLPETPSKDDFHDEVIFLLSFLNDPPNNTNPGEVIDDLFWEDVYGFLPFDDTQEDFITKKVLLNDFISKIGTVNAKIRHLYCEFPDDSLFNFPKLVSPLFLDFIIHNIRNLKERMISDRKYVLFPKYKIIKIEEELVSIRDFQRELNETWLDVVDFVHLTEHVISSSISSWFVFDHPIWYHMGNLSNVLVRIKVFKTKLQKIKENERSLPPTASIISTPSEQARPSQINELVVGFEDDAEKIIGMLTRGSRSLDIVSIVGIGGLGKTTIAKKVYGSSSVKGSFDVFAFCSISQDYNARRLLIDILIDINGQSEKDRLSEMTKDDLAHQLWKCLSHRKYLIVLDDIRDVSAWNEVESSFPNHNNGSRLMFTTRLNKVADICKISSDPYRPSQINELVVGFEDEAEKLIGMLTQGSRSLDIVSIVGIGGLGKTTLAKKVYRSVKCDFDVSAFCSISQDYDPRRLLINILIDLNQSDYGLSEMTKEDLAHKLWRCLSRRKYLILLDDIWDVNAWDKVKSSFPNHNNGSRLMFTTRLYNVANMCKISCDSCDPHRLRHLSPVESWELFQRKVFHDGISPPYLYEIGRKITANCKGLPLAVIVIAGLLSRTEKSLEWWTEVEKNVKSHLYSGGCMKILELSYKHLPEILKPCLLYLASFPEGTLIRVKKVILLWIAEGFVQESTIKSLEEMAIKYLNDLVDRNLVIVSSRSSNGGIKYFRVHDLIYELCRTKCREGNFSLLNHGLESSGFSDDSIKKTEYVYSQMNNGRIHKTSEDVSISAREFSLRELRLVQVLYFEHYHKFDAETLTCLVHLRHVDAYFQEGSPKSIPQSICNIWNIGSLILEQKVIGESIHFTATFWRMKSLRHVQVKNCILQFPHDGHDEYEAYPKLDKVIHFSQPLLFSVKDVQRLLQRLPAVQKLSCRLEISNNDHRESVEILDFHRKLESLKLKTEFGMKRIHIHFPPTLKKLTLYRLALMWTDISAIAELHFLEVLKLRQVFIKETVWAMEEFTFHKLKFFELNDIQLVEWKASIESFPCLEQLVIKYCGRLEDLPPCFGEIPTLKRIVLKEEVEVLKSSAIQIQDEQRDVGIEVEVLIELSYYDTY